ncbi:hypothetical protein [Burkholderia sp. AW49-1]
MRAASHASSLHAGQRADLVHRERDRMGRWQWFLSIKGGFMLNVASIIGSIFNNPFANMSKINNTSSTQKIDSNTDFDFDKEHKDAIAEQKHLALLNMQQMRVAAQCTFMKTCAQNMKDAAGRQ